MRSSLSVGRIFGIEIQVDYSWFIIFILIAWSLAVGCFPSGYYWGVALVTSLLFFIASVLAHELAHSLVARAHGTPVKSIKLFIFGGVSQIAEEPANAHEGTKCESYFRSGRYYDTLIMGILRSEWRKDGTTVLE